MNMYEYFDSLESGLEQKIQARPDLPHARKTFALEIARLGKRLFSEHEKTAWCGVLAPFDLLNAMGVNSCFVEFVGAMLASANTAAPMLEYAGREGYSTDSCAYHRAVIGAALQGMMPLPDFLVATTAPCTGGLATIENLARLYKKELFVIHLPNDRRESDVKHLADQLRAMVDFVSEHTGEPLDLDRLKEAVEHTNRARTIMDEVYTLAQQVPSPVQNKDLKDFGIVMALFLGTGAAERVAQAYKDEMILRLQSMDGSNERARLLWIQNRIQFRNPLIRMLDEQYGATIVVDELNSINWDPIDPDDPYTGLAERMLVNPLQGRITHRIKHMQKLASDYKVDGAINPCHWGCRQGTGARGLIQRGLNAVDVPVLNLEVDCIDQRNFSEGQIRTRLEAFFEMIEGRRSGAS